MFLIFEVFNIHLRRMIIMWLIKGIARCSFMLQFFQLLEHAFPTGISHLNSIRCIEDTRCHNEKLPSTEELKRLGNTHKRLLRLILPFSTHSKTFFFVITPLYVEPSNFFGSSNSLASKSFNKFLEAWRSSILT